LTKALSFWTKTKDGKPSLPNKWKQPNPKPQTTKWNKRSAASERNFADERKKLSESRRRKSEERNNY
jgi:hypothetical protein